MVKREKQDSFHCQVMSAVNYNIKFFELENVRCFLLVSLSIKKFKMKALRCVN